MFIIGSTGEHLVNTDMFLWFEIQHSDNCHIISGQYGLDRFWDDSDGRECGYGHSVYLAMFKTEKEAKDALHALQKAIADGARVFDFETYPGAFDAYTEPHATYCKTIELPNEE